jgi:hypothetical protein
MTEKTQELVLGALDAALTQQVCHLFEALVSSADDQAVDRFKRGLNLAVGVHEQLVAMIGPAD